MIAGWAEACLLAGIGLIGSGLIEGEFSSLLGGVLKGDTRASEEGLRATGWRILAGGIALTFGFAGILGLSARLTGGGTTFGLSSCESPLLDLSSVGLCASEGSTLGDRGIGVEDRLEC